MRALFRGCNVHDVPVRANLVGEVLHRILVELVVLLAPSSGVFTLSASASRRVVQPAIRACSAVYVPLLEVSPLVKAMVAILSVSWAN
jgi:hypothetical protein